MLVVEQDVTTLPDVLHIRQSVKLNRHRQLAKLENYTTDELLIMLLES